MTPMTPMTPIALTDALLHDALTPSAGFGAPNGLLADIGDEIRRRPQRRAGVRWPWGRDLGVPLTATPSGRLALALLVLGLVVALAAGALIGAQVVWRDPPREPPATGIETLPGGAAGYDRILRDDVGTWWALARGRVARFAPGVTPDREWTISDDMTFAAGVAAAARAGGIWLWHDGRIRRFDGTAFRESVPAPPSSGEPSALAELDGALWAATQTGGPWHWDQGTWIAPAPGGPAGVWPLLVVAPDDIWAGGTTDPGPADTGIYHFDGQTWTGWGRGQVRALGGTDPIFARTGDGTVFVATADGVARYDGTSWTELQNPQLLPSGMTVDADGTVWIAYVDGDHAARLDGDRWVAVDPTPSGTIGDAWGVTSTPAGMTLSTPVGPYRFADGTWEPAWPLTAAAGPLWLDAAIAVGPDDVWATEWNGMWHYVDGGWTAVAVPADREFVRLLLADAGSGPLIGTDHGVFIRESGAWTQAWSGDAYDAAMGPDGTIWLAPGVIDNATDGAVARMTKADGTWTVTTKLCTAGGSLVAVAATGTVWTGGISYGGTLGLGRYDGRTCEEVFPLGHDTVLEVTDLVIDPVTDEVAVLGLVPAGSRDPATGEPLWRSVVVRSDGSDWTTLADLPPDAGCCQDLAVGPDGDLWLGGGNGLRRYHAGAWQQVVRGMSVRAVSVAPDGTVVFAGPSGLHRIAADALPD